MNNVDTGALDLSGFFREAGKNGRTLLKHFTNAKNPPKNATRRGGFFLFLMGFKLPAAVAPASLGRVKALFR